MTSVHAVAGVVEAKPATSLTAITSEERSRAIESSMNK